MEESTLALAQSLAKQVTLFLKATQGLNVLKWSRQSTKSHPLGPRGLPGAMLPFLPRRFRVSGKRLSHQNCFLKSEQRLEICLTSDVMCRVVNRFLRLKSEEQSKGELF